ncbi:hypothetical protein ZYGR_0BA00350 [Zygosaccharomyces rouxii]|uniref:ATP-dependent DNA helicase RRM3 n=1 Tax=Zygosaccharomyces rouxii TaxID=4956 RepID=A0A1Q3AK67_ZYGRO|nr:hypothetical protein ZYGR_0BA00350 [Zygosaccharomyces rouxii]
MFRGRSKDSKSKDQPASRQMSISSFFGSKTVQKRPLERTPAPRPNLKRISSSLTDSGSFEECDPDDELKRLVQTPELNNFKPCKKISLPRSFSNSQESLITRESSRDETNNSPLAETKSSLPGFKVTATKRLRASRRLTGVHSSSFGQFTPMALTKEQEQVINLVVNNRLNVFYTGSAGTGKSVILRTLIDRLSSVYGREAVAVTASTGLAAATIGGTTIHRWCGIGLGNQSVDHLVKHIKKQRQIFSVWRFTKVLIIDEISMLDGRMLDKIEMVARRVRQNEQPFGGIQLVLTGDFFQLPPVSKDGVVFSFESQMWKNCIQRTILLTKVFRQRDDSLVDILNTIRYGEPTPQLVNNIAKLKREVHYSDGIEPTELYATRKEVELSNSRQLQTLPGETKVFKSLDVGPPELLPLLDSITRVEKILTLKVDAQVMMIRNKPDSELVNGTLGKVLFFTTERLERTMKKFYQTMDDELVQDMRLVSEAIANQTVHQDVEFHHAFQLRPRSRQGPLQSLVAQATSTLIGQEPIYPYVRYTIGPNRYHYELTLPEPFVVDLPAEKTAIERTQLPITLCWALSIHKAQGQTIQRLKVDLRRIFEAGQVYVALSRAVSMDNLQVLNFDPRKIRANAKVKDFYKSLETVA